MNTSAVNRIVVISLKALLLSALLLSATGCTLAIEETNSNRTSVQLMHVIDGDTLSIQYKGKKEKVRLLLVDTPEMTDSTYGIEPYAQEAKDLLVELTQDADKLDLEFDNGPERDKYSRLLAYVYVDGVMLQEALLESGLARVAYIYPPNVRYVESFEEIQEDSQGNALGIWSVDNYTQKDGFHPEIMIQGKKGK